MPKHMTDMLICMRTTILLPDELYTRVREVAASERRTVTSLIEEALRAALRQREQPPVHPPFRIDPITGGSLVPGVDLDDNSTLADLMDDN